MSLKPLNIELLTHRELRTIFDMSRVILQAVDSASALKEIIKMARPVFIFDNVVLYQPNIDQSLEPIYARSVGRGRSREADMAWGETIAQEVLAEKDILLRHENLTADFDENSDSRLNSRYFLGLPLTIDRNVNGALIFVRFGGPDYLPEQVNLAQLIAEHIEHLLVRQNLVGQIASLEAKRKLDYLQQEFVATVSHDLRSPLGFIKGYTTTLLRDDANWNTETSREFLNIIDEEADRLVDLIDNLLDSSRLQTGTLPMSFQDVNLETFLKEFANRAQMGEINVEIRLELEKSVEDVKVDPTRMIQVFDNLISNAVKYAPGSPITISLKFIPDFVHVKFIDEGPGIPGDQLENIFQRFYRLPDYRDQAKGCGLGLFICKKIINAHKGKIFAESTLDKGAKFNILLPRIWTSDGYEPNEEEIKL